MLMDALLQDFSETAPFRDAGSLSAANPVLFSRITAMEEIWQTMDRPAMPV